MNGWLIYREEDAERNQGFITWLQEEAIEQGINLKLVLYHTLSYGVRDGELFVDACSTLPDFVMMRVMDSLLSQQFEYLQIPVFNKARVAEIANNKAKTHQLFGSYGIAMADTYFLAKDQVNAYAMEHPFILKEAKGRSGKQVYKIEQQKDLPNVDGEQYIVQAAAVYGKDLRVFVMGNEIIGAVLRSSDHDFKSNYSLGGTIKLYTLSEQEKNVVKQIMDILPADFIGIDFVFDEKGRLLLNEIEDVVGSRSLVDLTNINIASMYIRYIVSTLLNGSRARGK
ncbi:ATP-grasp domain-containing protein [Gracilibacillus timonensis]|uniref:ATP-grasp domain-containing protein n=1 Tax=Gracilibacillus timonensis TaxID=1816696 RepID=UPI0008246E65|nr:hypothetical protein [Gracilibacillus timonensis]